MGDVGGQNTQITSVATILAPHAEMSRKRLKWKKRFTERKQTERKREKERKREGEKRERRKRQQLFLDAAAFPTHG